jgi:hypothetical protein
MIRINANIVSDVGVIWVLKLTGDAVDLQDFIACIGVHTP